MSLSTCSRDIPYTSFPRELKSKGWRRGSESNTPRLAKQTDSGFEDREGHQAPITLRILEKGEKGNTCENAVVLAKVADLLEDRIRLRELAGGSFRINLLSIYSHFKHAPARWYQPERSDLLLQLEQFIRQTDGMRFIVSSRAIFNCDFQRHCCASEARKRADSRQAPAHHSPSACSATRRVCG